MSLVILLLGVALGFCLCFKLQDRFFPAYLQSQHGSELAACASNAARIGLALQTYKQDNGAYPASQYELVPTYLMELPSCPAAGRLTYRTSFGEHTGFNLTDNPDYFVVECCGTNHRSSYLAPNLPAFDNLGGLRMAHQW